MTPQRLRIEPGAWRAMADHVEACLPEEGCGLLSGVGDRVTRAWPVENIAHSPLRYHMAPRELVRAIFALEASGDALLAAFHSHPAGPTGVSVSDVAEWRYPEAALAVCGRPEGRWAVRAFVISGDAVREIPVTVTEAG